MQRAQNAKIGVKSMLAGLCFTISLPAMQLAAEDVAGLDPAISETRSSNPQLDYYIVDQRIGDFLSKVALDGNVRIQPSDAVRGRISGVRMKGAVPELLEQLASDRDLDWFLFNDTYYLTARNETKARLIRLGPLPFDVALAALERTGLAKESFPVRPAAEGSAMVLSGPPIYLGFSEAVIESTPNPAVPAQAERFVRIRRGGKLAPPVAVGEADAS